MTLRKVAAMIAALGLIVGLFGAGISAQFSDGATATMSVKVGTFGIDISSTQGTVVGDTLTCTAADILSSAPGIRSCVFTVTNVGTMPATVSVAASLTGATARFHDMFDTATQGAPRVIAPGGSYIYSTGGIEWDQLINDDLGRTVSVTYTIVANG